MKRQSKVPKNSQGDWLVLGYKSGLSFITREVASTGQFLGWDDQPRSQRKSPPLWAGLVAGERTGQCEVEGLVEMGLL